jgi:hypothetical protein
VHPVFSFDSFLASECKINGMLPIKKSKLILSFLDLRDFFSKTTSILLGMAILSLAKTASHRPIAF